MASTQLSTTESVIEELVVETSDEKMPAAEDTGRGLWRNLRWRLQNIYSNYMVMMAQEALIGSSADFDDP